LHEVEALFYSKHLYKFYYACIVMYHTIFAIKNVCLMFFLLNSYLWLHLVNERANAVSVLSSPKGFPMYLPASLSECCTQKGHRKVK
jgi:hypothetical protein